MSHQPFDPANQYGDYTAISEYDAPTEALKIAVKAMRLFVDKFIPKEYRGGIKWVVRNQLQTDPATGKAYETTLVYWKYSPKKEV